MRSDYYRLPTHVVLEHAVCNISKIPCLADDVGKSYIFIWLQGCVKVTRILKIAP